MTAKTLMFEDTIGGVLYRSEKATNPFPLTGENTTF